MLKQYFHRENKQNEVLHNVDKRTQEDGMTNGVGSENQEINQTVSVACVLEDEETNAPVAVNDADALPLYNLKQKETIKDVIINTELNTEQEAEIRDTEWVPGYILGCAKSDESYWAQSAVNWDRASEA